MKTFGEWFMELERLGKEADFPIGHPDGYMEYFDDGDSPEETLALEMSYVEDEDEDEYDTYEVHDRVH